MDRVSCTVLAVIALIATSANAQTLAGNVDDAGPLKLRLACMGTGDHQVAHSSWGSVFSEHGSASAFGVSSSQDQFDEQMDVDLKGAASRARVPRRFLPPLHGGEGGWFNINDLTVTDEEITGTVLINFTNHPKLRIDRRTGTIALDGKVGAYAGQCRPVKEDERAF